MTGGKEKEHLLKQKEQSKGQQSYPVKIICCLLQNAWN